MTDRAREYFDRLFSGESWEMAETDPELWEIFTDFAFDEVVNSDDLDDRTRFEAILATLLGSGASELFSQVVPAAINSGLTPVEIKEIIYQSVAYLGMGRIYPFIKAANKAFSEEGVKLPLPGQSTVNAENRRERGNSVQVSIFGDNMKEFWETGSQEIRNINIWLADNCFGDYYTRTGLNNNERELITFCFLAAQGGCEPQLVSHASVNMRIGNDKAFLIKVISQCLPYIGYPRSLNAVRCVNEAAAQN